jgi:predicted RNase H-like HicB family nuclease
MIMTDITVEGFAIKVERVEKGFAITVPELPGVIGQVEREDQVRAEIGKLIRAHLRTLATERPRIRGNVFRNGPKPEPRKLNRP